MSHTISSKVHHLIIHPPDGEDLESIVQLLTEDLMCNKKVKRFTFSIEKNSHIHCMIILNDSQVSPKYWFKEYIQPHWSKRHALVIKPHADEQCLLAYITKDYKSYEEWKEHLFSFFIVFSSALERKMLYSETEFYSARQRYENKQCDYCYDKKKPESKARQEYLEKKTKLLSLDAIGEKCVSWMIEKRCVSYLEVLNYIDDFKIEISDQCSLGTYQRIKSEVFIEYVTNRLQKYMKIKFQKNNNSSIVICQPEESVEDMLS